MPGDFAFPINDAICDDKELRWIGCCNELNAAYAADGYARIRGMSVLMRKTTTIGDLDKVLGELENIKKHEQNLIFEHMKSYSKRDAKH